MLLKEEKTAVIEANKTHENDTGSPEVQIAILLRRRTLTDIVQLLKSLVSVSKFYKRQSGGILSAF